MTYRQVRGETRSGELHDALDGISNEHSATDSADLSLRTRRACHALIAMTPASRTRTAVGSETGGAPSDDRLAAVALAVALLPFLVSAVALVVKIGGDYLAGGDIGLTELRTSDVGRHPVLLGPYSRDGWNHPGPALFYALALPYRLTGSHSIGLALGALLINGLAIAGIALVARRVAGFPCMLLALVGCAVLLRSLGPAFLRDPWNPYITVLPFGLLVFLTWAMTCGKAWALPIGAGVASFCIQTHIGYAPIAVPLLAWGAASLIVLTVRRHGQAADERKRRSRALIRASVVAAAVLVVMWLPAIIQQFIDSPGNLTEVVRYFNHPNAPMHSFAEGYRAVSGQFELTPQWLTGHLDVIPFTGEPYLLYSAPLPLLLIPLGLALLAFRRWRYSDANRLGAVLLVTLALGVFAVSRIIGLAYAYRLRWTWFLGTVAFILVLWAGLSLISRRIRDQGAGMRILLFVPLCALVALSAINAVSAARAGTPQKEISSAVHTLGPAIEAALPRGHGDVLLRTTSPLAGYEPAILEYLERRGIAVRVDRSEEDAYGTHRVHQPDTPLRTTLTVAANEEFDELSTRPDLRLVAYWGKQTVEDRERLLTRRAELDAAYRAGTITLETLLHKKASLDHGSVVGVFMESLPH
jgi:hypothetical protein